MTKKSDTAASLAAILSAKRGSDAAPAPVLSIAMQEEAELASAASPPPPAPRASTPKVKTAVNSSSSAVGKRSNPEYRQFSLWLRKTTGKKVFRALDDEDDGEDFSELVETLLQKWLAARK